MVERVIVDKSKIVAVADAIRESQNWHTPMTLDDMAEVLEYVEPTAIDNDVVYIDYDGTVRYSYSADEFAQLTEHPAHPRPPYPWLTANDWNWTLSGAQAYVAKYKQLVIGQTYTPSGGTKVVVTVPEDGMLTGSQIYNRENNNTIIVDFGDGTEPVSEVVNNGVDKEFTHVYEHAGEYVITITHSGLVAIGRKVFNNGIYATSLSGYIKDVFLDPNVCFISGGPLFRYSTCNVGMSHALTGSIGNMFGDSGIDAVVFPPGSNASTGNSNWFANAYGLKYVSFPESWTGVVLNYNYSGCYSLKKVCPDETNINWANAAFNNCSSLIRIDVPSAVTAIGAQTFYNCYGLTELHFHGATPPSVANSNAFSNVPAQYCTIYVPTGSLEAYTSVTNYPSSETYTYVEE